MFRNQGVNKIILVGQIHGRPEWRTITYGRCLCFQLITIEDINKQGATYQHTEIHSIRVPESVIENGGEHFQDGVEVFVDGKITTMPSVDSRGVKRYDTAIIASKYSIMAKTPAQMLNTT
jgi:single-stranded DNA-binding protein